MKLTFRKERPTIQEVCLQGEAYYWIRGGRFNRETVVYVSCGTNSGHEAGKTERKYWAELNYTFQGDYPDNIWDSEIANWPGLSDLEWAGPIPRPQ